MVSNCANPKCGKPLHYLRDGRVFVFDSVKTQGDGTGKPIRSLEHFWLCGECSETMHLKQTHAGMQLTTRPGLRLSRRLEIARQALAS
jgi:hypothetical protein